MNTTISGGLDNGKRVNYRINDLETASINNNIEQFVYHKNQLTALNGPRVTRNSEILDSDFTINDIIFDDSLVEFVKRKFQSDACDKDESRKLWMFSNLKPRIKSMLQNLQSTDDNKKKRARLPKAESSEEKKIREEKERCIKLRDEKLEEQLETEKDIQRQRMRLKNEASNLITLVNSKLMGSIGEDNVTLQEIHDLYLSLERNRTSMINHINRDDTIGTIYNDVLCSLKELYTLSYDRKWNWGIDLRKTQDEILNRPEAIVLVPNNDNRDYTEIANDSTLKYEDRSYALSKIAKKNLDICRINEKKIAIVANKAINALEKYDEARDLHVKLYQKEEILYTSNSEKRIFSETTNVDVTDVDNRDELLAEEKENVSELVALLKVSIEKMKALDPSSNATRPTFFGALTCQTKTIMDPMLEPETESDTSKFFANRLNEIFTTMFSMKTVKIILPRKKQSNESNDA